MLSLSIWKDASLHEDHHFEYSVVYWSIVVLDQKKRRLLYIR